MDIGERLRELRFTEGYTLEYVGKIIGSSRQNLYKYENGIISNIPSDAIEKLAKLYNVSPGYIMGWEDLYGQQVKASESQEHYYHDIETRDIADAISKDSELKLLFSAARDASPEDLKTVHEMLKALKRKEQRDD